MIKTGNELGIGDFVNLIKVLHEKTTVNILLNDKRLNTFPLKIKSKVIIPNLTTYSTKH